MKKIGIIIFGLVFIGVGVFMFISGKNKEKNCTASAVGTVVEIKEDTSTDVDTGRITYTYYPIIEYMAGESRVVKQWNVGSSNPTYKINDKINILYNPNNIEEFIVKGDNTSNLFAIIFAVLGGVVVVFGIFKKI